MSTRLAKPALTTRGKNTDVCVALIPPGTQTFPTAESLAISSTPAAKGATTLTLGTATNNPMVLGQGLLFVDSATERQFLAVVDASAAAGVTELTVRALGEEIPANAVAAFPPRSALRTTADISKTLETEEIDTFDHEDTAYLPTTSSAEMSLDGMFGHLDPGRETLEAALDQGLLIYFSKTFAPPSDAYSVGEREEGLALVTSLEKPAPNDGMVGFNVSLQISGSITRTDPVPTA